MYRLILIIAREFRLSLSSQGHILNSFGLFGIISFVLYSAFNITNQHVNISVILLISYIITTALFSSHIFERDYEDSSLEQLLVSGCSTLFIAIAKILSFWIISLFIVGSSIVLCYLIYDLSVVQIFYIALLFALVSLVVTSVSAFINAVTINIKSANLLNFIIVVPLTVSFLLYSASILISITASNIDYVILITDFKIIGALSLISIPISVCSCSYILSKL